MKEKRYSFEEAFENMESGVLMEFALDVYRLENGQLKKRLSHTGWENVEIHEKMKEGPWWKHPYPYKG